MRVPITFACVGLAVLLSAGSARAGGEMGSISGAVFDEMGNPVEGATVRLTGTRLPGGRVVATSANGMYAFPLLPPGPYVVDVEKAGLGSSRRTAVVEVDRDTLVDLVLGLTIEETVEVVAALPTIDVGSTEVNFNYTQEQIATLPLERSYAGLFQLVPGVAENNAFAPVAGGSRQDNTYLMDGVNITNPLFGYLATEVNELDIVEFNVKRGAISAEFGRSTGFVTNAVSRSGANEFSGSFRFEMIPKQWIGGSDHDISFNEDRYVPAFGVGGPLVRDRAFFYASGRFGRATTHERVNNVGPVPDARTASNELFGKITSQPRPSHFVNGSYRHRPSETKFGGVGLNDSPEVATDTEGTNRLVTLQWSWFLGNRTSIDVKFLRLDEENESLARTDLGFQPSFDVNRLAAMGYVSDPATGFAYGGASLRLNTQNYARSEVRATFARFFDWGRTVHQFKAGFGWEDGGEDLTRESNGWGTVAYVQAGTRLSAVYYPAQPSQQSKSRTYGLFVQDDATLTDRLTVNLGVLLNRDEFAQQFERRETFLAFGLFDEVQPRVGVNYVVRKAAGDKLYANYGRYYALDQKSSARALATRRAYTEEALFDLAGRLISQTPQANTVSKNIDPDLTAPYTDEFLVGYATPLGGQWSFDAFFQLRDANDFIEDVPTVLPNSRYLYTNDPFAERRYRTLTMEVNRRLADRWALTASYAWSKLYGNYDQDYSFTGAARSSAAAVFNTSSLINDGPGAFTDDTFRQGVLTEDRTHVFKVFATFLPFERTTVGAYLRTQSGTPWEARGLPWGSTLTYLRYLEPAGTRRNDAWTNVDLLLSYAIPLAGRAQVKLEGRVLNLFDAQTALSRDPRQFLDGRIRTIVGAPPPDCRSCWTDAMVQGRTRPNPSFGEPTSYATPRRFLLSIHADF